jgi:hypothetical protein
MGDEAEAEAEPEPPKEYPQVPLFYLNRSYYS